MCVRPSRSAVSESCRGDVIYQFGLRRSMTTGRGERQPLEFVLDGITWKNQIHVICVYRCLIWSGERNHGRVYDDKR